MVKKCGGLAVGISELLKNYQLTRVSVGDLKFVYKQEEATRS